MLQEMTTRDQLHSFELMVILVPIRLGNKPYSVPICEELEKRTGREVAVGSVHVALERMEDKGFVRGDGRLIQSAAVGLPVQDLHKTGPKHQQSALRCTKSAKPKR
jgi:hypothetical protein